MTNKPLDLICLGRAGVDLYAEQEHIAKCLVYYSTADENSLWQMQGSGVVISGLDAPANELACVFEAFSGLNLVKGFAVGRTIFAAAALGWLHGKIDDEALIKRVEKNYSDLIDLWQRAVG